MLATIRGIEARLCDEQCRSGYQCDREHGLIYTPCRLVDEPGQPIVGIDEASVRTFSCAYCNAYVPEDDPNAAE